MATAVSPEGFKILVVDNDNTVKNVFQETLTNEGFKVRCAFNGSQAIRFCGIFDFDIVISDWEMPDQDASSQKVASGEFLISWLQKEKPEMKIIVISAKGRPRVLSRHIPFFQKPVLPSVLITKVKKLLLTKA